jgi:hypothetical protein
VLCVACRHEVLFCLSEVSNEDCVCVKIMYCHGHKQTLWSISINGMWSECAA